MRLTQSSRCSFKPPLLFLQIRNIKNVEGLKVKPNQWFGTIVLFTLLTMLIVYVVPSDSPFSVLSYVFGFTFVSIAPGYCLVSVLFPAENKLDFVEKTVLSVALSFSLVGLAGRFFCFFPPEITFLSTTGLGW